MEEITTDHILELSEVEASIKNIDKKIILINSSRYTDEAFEYLLDLVDENESIAFIINERKIYSHGEYFGGDLWEDSLNYFSKYALLDQDGNITTQIYAQSSKDAIQFKGEGGIELSSDYDIKYDTSTINIKFDLTEAIDQGSIVQVDNYLLALSVNGKKIALEEYKGALLKLNTPTPVEFDSGNIDSIIHVDIDKPEILTKYIVTSSGDTTVDYDPETYDITVHLINNFRTFIYVDYNDGRIDNTAMTIQEWGYAFAYGTRMITKDNFDLIKKEGDIDIFFTEKEIEINIPDSYFGWFAYPKSSNIIFTDIDTGISGGWRKYSTFRRYTTNIEYQVYRTEYSGLGQTKWKITAKN